MFLDWDDRYRVGHEQIDRQHQRLFELINDLVRKAGEGADRQDSLKTVNALVDYALEHFADEESLMQRIGYDDIDRHRWRHSEFAGKIADMAVAWGEGHEITAGEICEFLKDWLVNHILIEDLAIGAAVRRGQPTRT